jgi:hypothetical protein
MHLALLDHSLAGILGVSLPELLSFVIPIAGIVIGGVIAVSAMYFHNQRKQQWHETARLALEKGQPLPSLPSEFNRRPEPQVERNDFRAGLILIGVGLGLSMFFVEVGARSVSYLAAIPGFIGAALVVNGLLTALFSRKKSGPEIRPPQP